MSKEKAIGVCGGVGQAASNELCAKYITPNCDNGGSDAGQIPLFHVARAVPDRTKYLLGEEPRNPADEMIKTLRAIRAAVDAAEGSERESSLLVCLATLFTRRKFGIASSN